MYLLERLFGIAAYVYMLGMACVLIAFTKVNIKTVLRLYIAGLCVMGFFYTPSVTGDLYRIYGVMDWYATMELGHFFEELVITSTVPAARLLFWAVAKTGINRLLPVVSAIICYGMIFSCLDKSRRLCNISRQNFAIALFVLMTTSIYISVVGGIRMMIAMALVVYCFFRETVEHKFGPRHVIFYLIAVLMHNMGVVMLVMRLITVVLDGSKKLWLRLGIVAVAMAAAAVVLMRYGFFVTALLDKVYAYLVEESHSDTWEYIIGLLLLAGVVLVYVKYRACGCPGKYPALKELNFCMHLSTVLGVLFCFVFTIFYRFVGHLTPILAMPMLMGALQESEGQRSRGAAQIPFRVAVLLYGCIVLIISCTRGSLSSLKFFVLS